MEQKVIKIGNSLGIILPSSLRRKLGVKEAGDTVFLEEQKEQVAVKPMKKAYTPQVNEEFKHWLDEFTTEHEDVLRELAKK